MVNEIIEEWRKIPKYEEYEVSNLSRVKDQHTTKMYVVEVSNTVKKKYLNLKKEKEVIKQ